MLKKGVASLLFNCVWAILLSVVAIFIADSPVQARSDTDDNGCFIFSSSDPDKKDQIVCPDQFCGEQSYCDPDGKRCYCIPRTLASSDKNNYCEVVFGSKMKYDFRGSEPEIYLYGGLWTEVADFLQDNNKTGNIYTYTDDGTKYNAILFKQENDETFKSGFLYDLTELINNNNLKDITAMDTLLDISISPSASSAYASNQRYRITKGGASNECGLYLSGDKMLFSKYSPVPLEIDSSDQYKNICILPASILKLAIFGQGKVAWPDTKARVSKLTRNCTDLPWSQDASKIDSLLGWFDALLSDHKNNNDMQILIANMIVPYGQQRMVYFDRPDNFLLGEIIDGSDNTEAVKRIRNGVCKKCAASGLGDTGNCQECNGDLLDLVAKSSDSLNEIIAKELLKNGGGKVCANINRSFDNISGASDSYKPSSNSEEETKINKTLPSGLLYICENANLSDSDQLKCKKNALTCYMQSLNEHEPAIGCENLVGELDTSRWIVCPAANTAAAASDQGQSFVLDLIRNSGNLTFFNDSNFNNAWKFFRNMSNALLIVAIIALIISYITGFGLSNYQIKRIAPRLIIVIVFINLSIFIAKLLIDVSNISGTGIYNLLVSFKTNDASATFINTIGSIVAKTGTVAALGSAILLLAAIGLLVPSALVMIFGLFFIFVMLAMRQALMILLIVLMPVAFVSLLFPFTEKLFNTWSRNFINVLLVYPIMCSLIGSGVLLKSLLLELNQGTIVRLIALIMPVLTTCLAPFVLTSSLNGLELIKNKINSIGKAGAGLSYKTGYNSTFNKNLSGNLQRAIGTPITKSRAYQGMLRNSAFNYLTAGAGQRLLHQQLSKDAKTQQQYSNIIGNDRQLLQAFVDNSTSGLNVAQQQKFRMLTNLGANNDNLFYLSAINTAAKNGFADQVLLQKIVAKAEATGTEEGQITGQLRAGSAIARKSGHVSTAGLLNYNATHQGAGRLSERMRQPIDHDRLLTETTNILQKTPVASLDSSNFSNENLIATDAHPSPTQSIVEEAIDNMVQDDLNNVWQKSVDQRNFRGTFTESLGHNFDFMNPEVQKVVGNILINTSNSYSNGSNHFSTTAQEAIDHLNIRRKS